MTVNRSQRDSLIRRFWLMSKQLSLSSCFLFGHLLQCGEHEIWHTCVLSPVRGKVRKALCQKFMPLLTRKVEWACVRKALFAMFPGELRVERTRMVS